MDSRVWSACGYAHVRVSDTRPSHLLTNKWMNIKSSGIKQTDQSVCTPKDRALRRRQRQMKEGKACSSVSGSAGRGTEGQAKRNILCTLLQCLLVFYEFALTYFDGTKRVLQVLIPGVTEPRLVASLEQVIHTECCVRTWQGPAVHGTGPRLSSAFFFFFFFLNALHTILQTCLIEMKSEFCISVFFFLYWVKHITFFVATLDKLSFRKHWKKTAHPR